MQLWIIKHRAAFVTSIVNYSRKKACRFIYLGGEGFQDWMGVATKTLEAWAKANGCDYVEIYGRRGWVREGIKYGYKETYTTVMKEI